MMKSGLRLYPADEINPQLDRAVRLGLAAGLAGLILFIIGGFLSGFRQFLQSYLFVYMFLLELTLGSLMLVMLHLLVGGRWGMVIRRTLEAAARTIWLMALLFIPLAVGVRYLYPWAQPEVVAADPILQLRTLYLNLPFFLARAVIFFLFWIFLTVRLTGWSGRPEYTASPSALSRLRGFSALGIVVYGLTMTFAAVDWLKALDAHWYSSIYPLLIIVGQALGSLALTLALTPALAARTTLGRFINRAIYRDLGAIMLSTVLVWAYIAFSQYIIIWGANLPHEVTWYLDRTGGWLVVLLLILAVQFVLPFLVLLSLAAKRNRSVLATLSALIVAMRLVDHFWQVKPTFSPVVFSIHWMDLVAPVALGGLWLAFFAWNLKRTSLVLPHEPPLSEEEEKRLHRGHPPVRA
jgi:hypothetical protein